MKMKMVDPTECKSCSFKLWTNYINRTLFLK